MNLSKLQLEYLLNALNNVKTDKLDNKNLSIHKNLVNKIKQDYTNYDKEFINDLKIIKDNDKLTYQQLSSMTNISIGTLERIINNSYIKLSKQITKKIRAFVYQYKKNQKENKTNE